MNKEDNKQNSTTTEKYHHVVIKDKDSFVTESFRTVPLSEGQGMLAVIGKSKTDPKGNMKTHKYLFDINKRTMDEAKDWVKEHPTKDIEYAINLFLLFKTKYNIDIGKGILDDIEEAVNIKNNKVDENVSLFNWYTKEEGEKINSTDIQKDGDNETVLNCIIIEKKDEMKRIVYGVVYTPMKADWHKNFMRKEEIEISAHTFLLNARNIDQAHDHIKGSGGVVESFIARKGDPDFAEGSWVIVTKVFSDTVWADIMSGKIKGYSMAGMADYGDQEEVDTDIDFPKDDD